MYNKEEIDLIKYFIDSGIDFEKFEGIRNEERYPAGGSVELIFDGKPLYIRNGFSRYYIGYLKRDERNGSISNIPKLFDYFDNYRFKNKKVTIEDKELYQAIRIVNGTYVNVSQKLSIKNKIKKLSNSIKNKSKNLYKNIKDNIDFYKIKRAGMTLPILFLVMYNIIDVNNFSNENMRTLVMEEKFDELSKKMHYNLNAKFDITDNMKEILLTLEKSNDKNINELYDMIENTDNLSENDFLIILKILNKKASLKNTEIIIEKATLRNTEIKIKKLEKELRESRELIVEKDGYKNMYNNL